jgi:hypothetical protein
MQLMVRRNLFQSGSESVAFRKVQIDEMKSKATKKPSSTRVRALSDYKKDVIVYIGADC